MEKKKQEPEKKTGKEGINGALLLHMFAAIASICAFLCPRAAAISASDLQGRQSLQRSIQLAAFQQFDSHRTGRIYSVSVPGTLSNSSFQAIRLRSGSFKRYGVNLAEFLIPRGCQVTPAPERIILVYSKLGNISLFQSLPQDYVVASFVVSVFAYDATSLLNSSSLPPANISISCPSSTPISIQIEPTLSSSNLSCASFDENSTGVNYSGLVGRACEATQVGSFSLVTPPGNVAGGAQNASNAGINSGIISNKSNNKTWKIVVGSVVGGLALLVLLSLLAVGIGKRRERVRIARMEHQADQGETLQSTAIRNSRAPSAGDTRTLPTLESDDTV